MCGRLLLARRLSKKAPVGGLAAEIEVEPRQELGLEVCLDGGLRDLRNGRVGEVDGGHGEHGSSEDEDDGLWPTRATVHAAENGG